MAVNGKKKILVLSDHALSTSGVGTQSRFLINGLVDTGKYTVRQFGAAMKHQDYKVRKVNEDFIIKPVDGWVWTRDPRGNRILQEIKHVRDDAESFVLYKQFDWFLL